MSDQPLFSIRNPWFNDQRRRHRRASRCSATITGLILLPLAQPDLKLSGIWDAICSAAGVPRVTSQPNSIQPDFKTSNVVMTSEMLTRPRSGLDRPRRDAWRSAARSATGRRASATPIRRILPGNLPPSPTRN